MTNQNSKMSEKEGNTQSQKPRISKLAMASLAFSILGFLPLRFVITRHYPPYTHIIFASIMGLCGLFGLIFGVLTIKRILQSREAFRGIAFAVLSIVLGASILNISVLECTVRRWRSTGKPWTPCASNLQYLSRAIVIYERDNGQYPDPNRWCDLLLKDGNATAENFICPRVVIHWPFRIPKALWYRKIFLWPFPKEGRCHFAMNPKCHHDSPPGTVLLFETREGWNQFGGPEIMTFEQHNGKGCHILLKNRSILFVEPGQVNELSW
jgi:hypothetical protein